MAKMSEGRMRSRRRNSARAAISPRGLVDLGLVASAWVYGTRSEAVSRDALRPLPKTPEPNAVQRAMGKNMVRFDSREGLARCSIKRFGIHRRNHSGAA
jgi:hypothetical protein